MTGPDTFDDTSADPERFETELLASDRDACHSVTADITETAAHRQSIRLIDEGVITPVPGERVLVHEPSGHAFESIVQLAMFHRGWTAAHDHIEKNA